MSKKLWSFRIDEALLNKAKDSKKGRSLSSLINKLLSNELNNEAVNSKVLNSGDWQGLKELVISSPSLLVVGDVGSGKSFSIKALIDNDKEHKYILLNAHQDDLYQLPIKEQLVDNPENSYMIQLPKEVSASKPMFNIYLNMILSKKWKNDLILVVEEANRYKEVKALLRESRKFIKVIAVCQEAFCSFVPSVRIVRGENK